MNRYVFFASSEEYFNVGYREIMDLPCVHYQTDYLRSPNKILKALHSLHNFRGIAKRVDLPLKAIWYKKYFDEPYSEGSQYIFVFFYQWSWICQKGFVEYLRTHYPGCKCVLFLQDVNNAKRLDMPCVKKTFDHVMLFERNYAKQCGIEYYPLVYCEGMTEYHPTERPIDLLFVGGAKGRYEKLKAIYDRLSKEGVNCQFYLSRIDQEVLQSNSGIHIVDNVAYKDNIMLLKQAKCVLDIIPEGSNCNTLRMSEAICYGNRVLTNNMYITREEYYSPELISVYSSADDINVSFFKKPYTEADYCYKEKISPVALLRHLDDVFARDSNR